MFDKRMHQSAAAAYQIEISTETALQFIIQITALASGAIDKDDYIFEFETITGKSIRIPQSKL